jgi:hypothetical protein
LFHDGFELGAIGRFGERIGPAGLLDGPLAGGGRFLIFAPTTFGGDTDVVDLRTGARRSLPSGAGVMALDPARPRLILSLPGTGAAGTFDIAVFDIATWTAETIVTRACPSVFLSFPAGIAYAYDAQLAVVSRCSAPQVVEDLVAIDLAARPRQLRRLPVAPGFSTWVLSSDGQRLFVRTAIGFLTTIIEAYDVASGQVVVP